MDLEMDDNELPEMAAWHIPCYATYNCPEESKSRGGSGAGSGQRHQGASIVNNNWNLNSGNRILGPLHIV